MTRQYSNPPSLPAPRNYHHTVTAEGGRTIFISGQVAFDRERNIVGDDVVTQARQAFRNLESAVHAGGGTITDIVQLTIHVVDYNPAQLGHIAGTITEFFPPDRLPTNTLVGVQSLSTEGLLIEITGIAVVRA